MLFDTKTVQQVAAAMWKSEVLNSGSPISVYEGRTFEAFLDQDQRLQEKWIKLAIAGLQVL